MKHRYAWALCLLTACASSVIQDPPSDPNMISDAGTDAPTEPTDAGTDASIVDDGGTLVVGRPCTSDSDCGNLDGGYQGAHCQLGAPGGYCTFFCPSGSGCPEGSVCSPPPYSRLAGICMKPCATTADCRDGYACAITCMFPPASGCGSSPVCWEPQDAGP